MSFSLTYLKATLHYDAETGIFTRIRKSGPNVKLGPISGTHHSGYQFIRIGGIKYAAHRLAWFYIHESWPASQLDHINGNTSDNRILNLRPASRIENSFNRRLNKNSTSGYKGVNWHKAAGRWQARIWVNGKVHHLGWFDNPITAAAAYDDAARRLHGQFAKLNEARA